MKTLGERVRYRRLKLGIKSQSALARAINEMFPDQPPVSPQAIQQLEAPGDAAPKQPRYLARLVSVLRTNLLWLTNGEGQEEDQTSIGNVNKVIGLSDPMLEDDAINSSRGEMMHHLEELMMIYRGLSPEGRLALLKEAKAISFDETMAAQRHPSRQRAK